MKVLVPVKRVADPDTTVTVAPDRSDVSRDGVKHVVNPFDEIAVEEALRVKQSGRALEVVGVTIGSQACVEQLHTVLAMGVDRALLVRDDRALDPYCIARILRAVVEREEPDLVLMGKQAIDDDSNQTGQMLAGLLGWPQATFVSKLDLEEDGSRAACTRETDAGLEVIDVTLPAVVTADLRLNAPRYASLPGILKARSKPIETLCCSDLGVQVEPRWTVLALAPPPQRAAGVRVSSVDELVARLRDEAQVI